MNAYDVIVRPVLTEKSYADIPNKSTIAFSIRIPNAIFVDFFIVFLLCY